MSESLTAELRSIVDEGIGVAGALVATVDGLRLASVIDGAEPDTVAALASAASGLHAQFAGVLGLGRSTGGVVQAEGGCVAVHPLVGTAVLVLFTDDVQNLALLHLAVRRAVPRLTALLAGERPG